MFPASTGGKIPARTVGIDKCQSQAVHYNSANDLISQSNSKKPSSLIPLPKSVTNSPAGMQINDNAANHATTSPFNNSTRSGNSLDPQDNNRVCHISEAIVKSSSIQSLIVEHRNLMGMQSYVSEEEPKTLASYSSEFETAEYNMRDLLENFHSISRINETKDSDSFFTPSESLTDSETNHSVHRSSNVSVQDFQSAKSDSGVEDVLAEISPPVNQTVVVSVHYDAILIHPAEFECVVVEEIHIPILPLLKSDSEVTISIDAVNEEQIEFSSEKFERKLDSNRVVAKDELHQEPDSLATLNTHIYSVAQKMDEPSSVEINKILNLVLHEMNHLSIPDRGHLLLKSLKDLKDNCDSLKLVDLLLNHCDNEEGFQTCSDTLQYLVKLNASISADTEAKLFQILFKGIMSRQSSVRRSAFEISYHLVQINDLAWENNFYAEIREFAGTLKENMMRNMVSQRRLMH